MVTWMNSKNEDVYGAFICVFVRFDGDLQQLSDRLAKALQIEREKGVSELTANLLKEKFGKSYSRRDK